jgi:hypothetical protein
MCLRPESSVGIGRHSFKSRSGCIFYSASTVTVGTQHGPWWISSDSNFTLFPVPRMNLTPSLIIVEQYVTVRMVTYNRRRVWERESSVGRDTERYSECLEFESRYVCTFFSHCDINNIKYRYFEFKISAWKLYSRALHVHRTNHNSKN